MDSGDDSVSKSDPDVVISEKDEENENDMMFLSLRRRRYSDLKMRKLFSHRKKNEKRKLKLRELKGGTKENILENRHHSWMLMASEFLILLLPGSLLFMEKELCGI
ncbi:hypothetical protein KY285_033183 [Solanum tuberosum]|nr:hypothetical protein KY289_033287 [Solanum tuberosum]KAH0647935.1 hypothetical protein KY285_033183 [Solanum tuberosum]